MYPKFVEIAQANLHFLQKTSNKFFYEKRFHHTKYTSDLSIVLGLCQNIHIMKMSTESNMPLFRHNII